MHWLELLLDVALKSVFGVAGSVLADAYGQEAAEHLVRSCHRLATYGLAPEVRIGVLAELDSYLFESSQTDRELGYRPAAIGVRQIFRMLNGMPDLVRSRVVSVRWFAAASGITAILLWASFSLLRTGASSPERLVNPYTPLIVLGYVADVVCLGHMLRAAFGVPKGNQWSVRLRAGNQAIVVAEFQFQSEADDFWIEMQRMTEAGLQCPAHLSGKRVSCRQSATQADVHFTERELRSAESWLHSPRYDGC